MLRKETIAKTDNAPCPVFTECSSLRRITPEHEHWFFGYYDLLAMDECERRHLGLRVPFAHRQPTAADTAYIGCIDGDGAIKLLGTTNAWNFQQGSFLQFRPRHPNEIVYNVFDKADGTYRSVIHDLAADIKRTLPLPVANLSPKGDVALSVNFSRLYDYRPGYGYCNTQDPFAREVKPENDGVFLVDMDTGKVRLIVSYAALWERFAKGTNHEVEKLIVNHVAFNTAGTRFLMLLRFFSENAPWPTMTLTSDINGESIRKIFNFASHYHWKDSRKLVVSGANIANKSEKPDITAYEVDDETGTCNPIDQSFFKGDGHCSYSPDRQYMLYDSYPSKRFPYRKLQIYDLAKRQGLTLAYFLSDSQLYRNDADCRCDLHPRWSPNGTLITFDSIHEGYRAIYRIDAKEAISLIEQGIALPDERDLRNVIEARKSTSPGFRINSIDRLKGRFRVLFKDVKISFTSVYKSL